MSTTAPTAAPRREDDVTMASVETKLARLNVQLRELREEMYKHRKHPGTMRIAFGVFWGLILFSLFGGIVATAILVTTTAGLAAGLAGLAGGGKPTVHDPAPSSTPTRQTPPATPTKAETNPGAGTPR